jgi:hypothetical protein
MSETKEFDDLLVALARAYTRWEKARTRANSVVLQDLRKRVKEGRETIIDQIRSAENIVGPMPAKVERRVDAMKLAVDAATAVLDITHLERPSAPAKPPVSMTEEEEKYNEVLSKWSKAQADLASHDTKANREKVKRLQTQALELAALGYSKGESVHSRHEYKRLEVELESALDAYDKNPSEKNQLRVQRFDALLSQYKGSNFAKATPAVVVGDDEEDWWNEEEAGEETETDDENSKVQGSDGREEGGEETETDDENSRVQESDVEEKYQDIANIKKPNVRPAVIATRAELPEELSGEEEEGKAAPEEEEGEEGEEEEDVNISKEAIGKLFPSARLEALILAIGANRGFAEFQDKSKFTVRDLFKVAFDEQIKSWGLLVVKAIAFGAPAGKKGGPQCKGMILKQQTVRDAISFVNPTLMLQARALMENLEVETDHSLRLGIVAEPVRALLTVHSCKRKISKGALLAMREAMFVRAVYALDLLMREMHKKKYTTFSMCPPFAHV